MRGWVVAILLAIGLAFGARAQAPEPPKDAPRFGPFWLGMSPDEAKAAAPGVEWRITSRAPSGAALWAEAKAAGTFASRLIDAKVWRERYQNGVQLSAVIENIAPQACLEQGNAWISAVAATIGPMAASAPTKTIEPTRTQWATQRIEGALVVMPLTVGGGTTTFGEPLEVAPGVPALLDARREGKPWAQKRWARRPPDHFVLSARAPSSTPEALPRFAVAQAEFERRGNLCELKLIAKNQLAIPEPVFLDSGKTAVLRKPTIGERHAAALRLGTSISAAPPISFDCKVVRDNGKTFDCTAALHTTLGPVGFEYALRRLAESIVFDVSGVDRDDPQPMRTRITMQVTPDDLRPLEFITTPPTDSRQIRRLSGPSSRSLSNEYQPAALAKELEGQIKLTCQVQADFSAICANPVGRTPEETAMFGPSALRLMAGSLTVAPLLANGRPSSGVVFEQILMFALAQ
jgi:hypothetical protein